MTDSEIKNVAVIRAIICGALITLLVFCMVKPSAETPSVTSKTNFAVVDTYKGCDVVQWSDHNMATYKYFLHCNNTRHVYGEK